MEEEDAPLIFVYYHFRGQMQALRNILCYLELPFFEVFLERLAEQKKTLPP